MRERREHVSNGQVNSRNSHETEIKSEKLDEWNWDDHDVVEAAVILIPVP